MSVLFWRRRDIDDFADAIRPELAALPNPEPGPELLSRILASRVSGTRIILPEVDSATDHRRLSFGIAAAVIAAILLLAVIPREPASNRSTDETWASSSFLGNVAYAQMVSIKPEQPRMTFGRAPGFRPMTIRYTRTVRETRSSTANGFHGEVAISPVTVGGIPAWRVTSREQGATNDGESHADTVFAARSDLHMLSRAVHVSPYSRFQRINIQQRFAGDSVTGRMNTDGPSIGAGRAIARKLDPAFGPYFADSFMPLFFAATPLHLNWRGSASLLGWAVIPNDVFVPMTMRVDGDERVTVPAGTFDCWRISIGVADRTISYWARKSDGLGVRMYSDSKITGTREVVLTSIR
jgi:hypothetical protein